MTAPAKAMVSCVRTSGQRYGINVIIETVHGGKSAKILKYHMDENETYGTMEAIPVFRLRQVMNHLILNEYLLLTKEEYPVLHLTEKSRQLLEENEQVFMKAAKERKVEKKAKKDAQVFRIYRRSRSVTVCTASGIAACDRKRREGSAVYCIFR